ncbi:helix-turn-helix transcriptional regulator [Devosia sp.]|uniref:helix-turn-helix domain-containing protein n=1 Tax=Devosia sp. TaxID=1871048 RepID=UPI003266D4FC
MVGRERIAVNLRRIRSEQGVTQEVLAVDAGVDRTYVSGIERGQFNPTIDLLDRLAGALGVDVSKLVEMPADGSVKPENLKRGRKPS